MKILKKAEAVPQTGPTPYLGESTDFAPPRSVIRAGKAAILAWRRQQAAAAEVARIQAEEAAAMERHAVQVGLAETERLAHGRRERIEHVASGALDIVSHDGVMWLFRKTKIQRVHVDAALRFRRSWEVCNGTGVKSCLNQAAGAGGHSGPTDAMMMARHAVDDALKSLGSPMLHHYVIFIAGEGEMITGARFCKDARRASEHFLPCAIAFDMLARGYGMIR